MSAEDEAGPSQVADADTSFEVFLYMYDLSKELAKTITPTLLGKELPGVYHTSIVVHGMEYFFGSMGVVSCPVGNTNLQAPDRIISLGRSELTLGVFSDYLCEIGESSYSGTTYNMFHHNCNNFSQDVALFLTGNSIPPEVLEMPSEFLDTPLGNSLAAHYENIMKDL
ncbi:desumoylating isopeptidase 1-like [Amblyomma americanum]|uniref:PPPDE domain-containing protein n=1 Tax=Amblyomma americanum TaxID=6943 RepID=A0AAQ4DLT1_AMBAM